jgi:DNA-binding beta-propeller fold protein YncE
VPSRIISFGLSAPSSIFVAINGDTYVSNTLVPRQVSRWTPTATVSTVAMYTNGACFGLFIDRNDELYCSMDPSDQVLRTSSNSLTNIFIAVAGNGIRGLGTYMLDRPRGIFVDSDFSLFVADCGNNRVQRFLFGQLNGTTVAGNGVSGSITLSCPTEVILDMDGYLFIADYVQNRIIGSGPQGFRCIVGCTGTTGMASDQMFHPRSLSFDSDANLFVLEEGNSRIQQFLFEPSSCGE